MFQGFNFAPSMPNYDIGCLCFLAPSDMNPMILENARNCLRQVDCSHLRLAGRPCHGSDIFYIFMAVSILWPLYQNSWGQRQWHVFRNFLH